MLYLASYKSITVDCELEYGHKKALVPGIKIGML